MNKRNLCLLIAVTADPKKLAETVSQYPIRCSFVDEGMFLSKAVQNDRAPLVGEFLIYQTGLLLPSVTRCNQ
jgi:hypothetical protein